MPAKMADELTGFSNPDQSTEPTSDVKKKNKNKSSGGFQSMGFSFSILRGITKRGYKLPTPIQRKSIPIALEGRDVVAMARTGSGKTACFVLPVLEKLSGLNSKVINGKNLRALILSPTRELALQTLRFVRDLGKYTGLKSAAILGGDSIDQQFSVLTGTTPDVIVATPGRFLHICVEMNLQLSHIQMIVFDEADRLFELGFGEQLQEIVARLPSSRQSLLYSATLPKMLVEFARAGLSDPVLLRLDVEWKLPSTLWLGWVSIRSELRAAALLQLLDIILTPETPQAVVFVATKHHVDYLHLVLQHVGITAACVYSGLDPSARKISLGRFTAKKCQVLIVTDVAARGLDLPSLDTVINYHFPAKPKLFVHRVGRSARAGRSGRAFSFVSAEDTAHLVDLQLFLGTDLKYPDGCKLYGKACESGIFGTLPPSLLELRHADVIQCKKLSSEINDAARVANNAWQQYGRCREPASAASNKRAKEIEPPTLVHPFFAEGNDDSRVSADMLISQIKQYRPKGTILEIAAKNDSPMYLAMKAKKQKHGSKVNKRRQQDESSEIPAKKLKLSDSVSNDKAFTDSLATLDKTVVDSKKARAGKKQRKEVMRDENYIPHLPSDRHTEMGLAVNFNTEANAAQLELAPDSREQLRQGRQQMKWDRRRKKMVHVDADGGKKMIKTESGGRIPASFKSGRYSEWQKRNNASQVDNDSDDDSRRNPGDQSKPISEFRPRWVKHNESVAKKKAISKSSELRNTQQIVKERLRKDKIKARLKHKTKNKGKGKKRKK